MPTMPHMGRAVVLGVPCITQTDARKRTLTFRPPDTYRRRPMSDPRPRIDRSAAALGLVLVLAANARYLTGLAQVLDPMMSMDPFLWAMLKK